MNGRKQLYRRWAAGAVLLLLWYVLPGGATRAAAQAIPFTVQLDPTIVAYTGLSEVLGEVTLLAGSICGTETDNFCISNAGTIEVRFPNVTIDNSYTTGMRICEFILGEFVCNSPASLMTGNVTVTSNSVLIQVKGGVNIASIDRLTVAGVRARVADSVLSSIGNEALVTFISAPSNVVSIPTGTYVVARSADPLLAVIHAVPETPCEPGQAIPTVQIIEGYAASFVDHGDPAGVSVPGPPLAARAAYGGNANTRIRMVLTGLLPGVQVQWPEMVEAQNSDARIYRIEQTPDGASATYIYEAINQLQNDTITEIFAVRLTDTNFAFSGSGALSGIVKLQTQLLPPAAPATVRPRFNHPLEPVSGEPFFLLRRCAALATGSIQTRVVVDGLPWSGTLNYRLQGPTTYNGTMTETVQGLRTGSYTAIYNSGGPLGASFQAVSPSMTQTLLANGLIAFTFNFMGPTRAALELQSTPTAVCPVADSQVGTFRLVNTSPDQQIIPGGAGFAFTFSHPITAAPAITGLGSFTPTVTGSAMTFSIPGSVNLMPGGVLTFTGARLNLAALGSGQTVTVQFASTPTQAIQVPVSQVTLANTDTSLCPPPLPVFVPAGVTNGASFLGGATPGAITTLFGNDLTAAAGIVRASTLPLPTQLSGVSVSVNGVNAPLFAVASASGQEQINFQMPWEVAGQTSATLRVRNGTLISAPVQISLLETHPGVFTTDGTAGAILHGANSVLVTGSSPALPGEIVIVYATGLGPVSFPPATGAAALAIPLSHTALTPTVTVGGVPAIVRFSGLAPGFVGLYQLNVELAPGAPSGSQDLVVQSGGRSSKPVKIAIQ